MNKAIDSINEIKVKLVAAQGSTAADKQKIDQHLTKIRELEQSLTRMGVDHVDLIQLHNLVEPDEWETAHAPGGALDALVQARDEGLVRFIGVTGHGTRIADMHLRSTERFAYDSVLLPCNHLMLGNPAYRASFDALVALVNDKFGEGE